MCPTELKKETKMAQPLICLCLTGTTLEEDLEIADRYRPYIDLVELRVDWLDEDERLNVREFPSKVGLPAILTIRRVADGGKFEEGEASRAQLFARALAFAKQDTTKNFAYVDFEDDFYVPSLQDAALAFGTRIIRSFHDMKNPVTNIVERLDKMRTTGYEIPKIAFMPHGLSDITTLAKETSEQLAKTEQIICAMGTFGFPTRVVSQRFHSYLSFTSPAELSENLLEIGHTDPKTLSEMYRFKSINEETKLYGITGFPLKATGSPALHNGKFKEEGLNAVYGPFKAETAKEAFDFACEMDFKGYSVTVPHKEEIMPLLDEIDGTAKEIGACNTVINEGGFWRGYNTDFTGFSKALVEFVGKPTLKGKKVSVIGAGGAAKAIIYALKKLGAEVLICNRTKLKARKLAQIYGCDFAGLGADCIPQIQSHSDIIVQTTSKGMNSTEEPNENNDPLWFYDFTGREMLFDIVYEPNVTPIMKRAKEAGCKVTNGLKMLQYQGEEQFRLFKDIYGRS